jgi:hypothetical protein
MTSTGGPEAEFHDPRRQEILQALNDTLSADIRPTAWACLWLCDIDKLQEVLTQAQAQTTLPIVRLLSEATEVAKIVPMCRVIKLTLLRKIANIFRDSTKTTGLYLFFFTKSFYSTATFHPTATYHSTAATSGTAATFGTR